MLKTELWQDNGGGIHAIVYDGKDIVNVVCHLETPPTLSPQELISAGVYGFPGADPYAPDENDWLTVQQLASEFTRWLDVDGTHLVEPCQRIAVFDRDEITLYPRRMGYNALSLFGLTEMF